MSIESPTERKFISPEDDGKPDAVKRKRRASKRVTSEPVVVDVEKTQTKKESMEFAVESHGDSRPSLDHLGWNEDRLLSELADKEVFGVFDGMGGRADGEKAASMAQEAVTEVLKDKQANEITINDLVQALEKAHAEIVKANIEKGGDSMGTTGTIVKLVDKGYGKKKVLIARIGDSSVLKISKNGKVLESSSNFIREFAASVTNEPFDRKEEEAVRKILLNTKKADRDNLPLLANFYKNNRNIIDQALGVAETFNKIETDEMDLVEDETLLILSDGIRDNLLDEEIAEIVAQGGTSEIIANKLIRKAYDRCQEDNLLAKKDDMTAQVIRLQEVAVSGKELADDIDPDVSDIPGVKQFNADGLIDNEVLGDEETVAPIEEGAELEMSADEILADLFAEAELILASQVAEGGEVVTDPPMGEALLDKVVEKAEADRLLDEYLANPADWTFEEKANLIAEIARAREKNKKEKATAEESSSAEETSSELSESWEEAAVKMEAARSEELAAIAQRTAALEEELKRVSEGVEPEVTERVEKKESGGFLKGWKSSIGAFANRMLGGASVGMALAKKGLDRSWIEIQKRLEQAKQLVSEIRERGEADKQELARAFDAAAEAPASDAGVAPVETMEQEAIAEVSAESEVAKQMREGFEAAMRDIMARFKEKLQGTRIEDIRDAEKIFNDEIKDLLGDRRAVNLNLKYFGKNRLNAEGFRKEIDFMFAVNMQTAMRTAVENISKGNQNEITRKIMNSLQSMIFDANGFRKFGSRSTQETKDFFIKVLSKEQADLEKSDEPTKKAKARGLNEFIGRLKKQAV